MTLLKHTPLYDTHLAAGAHMTEFAGWAVPLHFGSQIEEHHAVRRDAGMFDVSHRQVIDLTGAVATPFLFQLLANNVICIESPGKAMYSCMLNERGGILDDFFVYRISHGEYRFVASAANAEHVLKWIRHCMTLSGAAVTVEGRRDLVLISVRGPRAIERARQAIPELNTSRAQFEPFSGARLGDLYISRAGYGGEDDLEIMVPATRAVAVWDALREAGVQPCGVGARDSLRLEAGWPLHGQDMDATTSPWDVGLGWSVDLRDPERDFVGRTALENNPAQTAFLGLVLDEPGMLESDMRVFTPEGEGHTTSGGFSPTLQQSIALARLPLGTQPDTDVDVEIHGRRLRARTVALPFINQGRDFS